MVFLSSDFLAMRLLLLILGLPEEGLDYAQDHGDDELRDTEVKRLVVNKHGRDEASQHPDSAHADDADQETYYKVFGIGHCSFLSIAVPLPNDKRACPLLALNNLRSHNQSLAMP